MRTIIKRNEFDARGNWNTAKDFFPTIEIEQKGKKSVVTITTQHSTGYQEKATGETIELKRDQNKSGDSLFVRGEATCKNWRHGKCSGSQKFVYAIFVGDSGHVYVHRAPATKGWLNAKPAEIKSRLRKLGIGIDTDIQQGDFLLKRANGKALPDSEFKHEYMGSGHHKFETPVLRAWDGKNTQVWIQESVILHHEAVDDIQHPPITIQPGKYVIGTTANSLRHSNQRD